MKRKSIIRAFKSRGWMHNMPGVRSKFTKANNKKSVFFVPDNHQTIRLNGDDEGHIVIFDASNNLHFPQTIKQAVEWAEKGDNDD